MSSSLAGAIPRNGAERSLARDQPDVSAEDIAVCRATLCEGSKSFHLASKLLPERVRDPAAALYAFCRLADDAVDLDLGGQAALSDLAARLDRIYGGRPGDDPMERALAATVRDYGLPRVILDALIEGLAWDAEGRTYETIEDLRAYAARVASTVGVASTLLMGIRSKAALSRAADLGVAMQLTNIARDVGEDSRAGRIYLPLAWMREAGIDPETWLGAPAFGDRLASVIERLLAEAERLYDRSTGGIALLPNDCRLGIHAARLIYREIGRELARRGHDSVSRRTVVPTRTKLVLMVRAFLSSIRRGLDQPDTPSLAETAFLIDAVIGSPTTPMIPAISTETARASIGKRIGWAIELFTRLEEQDQLHRASRRRPG